MTEAKQRRVIIVSGLSGAGKTVALNTLEDLGYYCIDNLPSSLLVSIVERLEQGYTLFANRLALGIDARNPEQELATLTDTIQSMREHGISTELIFIEATDDVLTRRFSETRRKHPLSSDQPHRGPAQGTRTHGAAVRGRRSTYRYQSYSIT